MVDVPGIGKCKYLGPDVPNAPGEVAVTAFMHEPNDAFIERSLGDPEGLTDEDVQVLELVEAGVLKLNSGGYFDAA